MFHKHYHLMDMLFAGAHGQGKSGCKEIVVSASHNPRRQLLCGAYQCAHAARKFILEGGAAMGGMAGNIRKKERKISRKENEQPNRRN